jgi:hypothetical protein
MHGHLRSIALPLRPEASGDFRIILPRRECNFLRTLVAPEPIRDWSMTTLKEKPIKLGAEVVSHALRRFPDCRSPNLAKSVYRSRYLTNNRRVTVAAGDIDRVMHSFVRGFSRTHRRGSAGALTKVPSGPLALSAHGSLTPTAQLCLKPQGVYAHIQNARHLANVGLHPNGVHGARRCNPPLLINSKK